MKSVTILCIFSLWCSMNALAGVKTTKSFIPPDHPSLKRPSASKGSLGAAADFSFRFNPHKDYLIPGVTTEAGSREWTIAPQAWIGLNDRLTLIPSFGVGRIYSYEDNSSNKTTWHESVFNPSVSLISACDDPCDDFYMFSGFRAGGVFGGGTQSLLQKAQNVYWDTDTKFSGFHFGAVVGVNYRFNDHFSGYSVADVLQYSRSTYYQDTKNKDQKTVSSDFSIGRNLRIGLRYDLR